MKLKKDYRGARPLCSDFGERLYLCDKSKNVECAKNCFWDCKLTFHKEFQLKLKPNTIYKRRSKWAEQ